MNNQHNSVIYKEQIAFSDVIFTIIRQWKLFLCLFLIIAIVLGGLEAFRQIKALKDPGTTRAAQEKYEEELETYNQEKTVLEESISTYKIEIERLSIEEKKALMLRIDPYSVNRIVLAYYIDSGYEIIPSMSYQNINYNIMLSNAYNNSIMRMDFDEIISEKMGEEVILFNPIKANNKSIVSTSIEGSNSILYITILCETKEQADCLAEAITKEIEEKHPFYESVVWSHNITLLSREESVIVDLDFKSIQETFASNKSNVLSSIKENKKKLEELEEPKLNMLTIKTVIKKVIKKIIIAFALALIIVIAKVVLMIIGDKILSAEDIADKFNIDYIGSLYIKEPLIIDKAILHKLGFVPGTRKEQSDFILTQIDEDQLSTNMLISSSYKDKEIETICNELVSELGERQIVVEVGTLQTADGLNNLKNSNSVLLVEKINKSSISNIAKMLSVLEKMKKEIVGYIIVD